MAHLTNIKDQQISKARVVVVTMTTMRRMMARKVHRRERIHYRLYSSSSSINNHNII